METRKKDPTLDSQISAAVEALDITAVEKLLKKNANPDAVVHSFRRNVVLNINEKKQTHLLHLAIEINAIQILKLLLHAGANPNITDDDGVSAIDLAIKSNNGEIISAFAVHSTISPAVLGEALSRLLKNYSANQYPLVENLLNQGADPNIALDGVSPLSIAARYCGPKVIDLLLRFGATRDNLKVDDRKKLAILEDTIKKIEKEPKFEKEKNLHITYRKAKEIEANSFQIYREQLQEKARIAKVQEKIDAFEKIYTALREGQSDYIKSNFITKDKYLYLCADAKLTEIQKHSVNAPKSRTAKAWELAQKHYQHCDPGNLKLFLQIYEWSFDHSVIKRSQVTGTTFFRNSNEMKNKLEAMREEQLNLLVDSSRSGKIRNALG